jgi:hypothetical protein
MRPRTVQSELSPTMASSLTSLATETPVSNRRERRQQTQRNRVRVGKNRVLATGTLMGGALLSATTAQAAPASGPAKGVRLAQANTTQNTQTGPVVSLLQPGYASTLRGKVKILVGIQGRKYAPKTIELFVDGKSATGDPVELDSSPSMEFNWDTTLFVDGPHRLTVRVTDVQGFIGQSETQVYINNGRKIDTDAPILAWQNVRDGDVLKGEVNLQLKANDDFGVKYIFVAINPAATPTRKPPLRQYLLNRPPYSFPFDTTKVPDGLYVLDALAWDALENEGKAEQRRFGVLNNPLNATLMADINKFGNSLPEAASKSEPTRLVETPAPPVNLPAEAPSAKSSGGNPAANAGTTRVATNTAPKANSTRTAPTAAPAPSNTGERLVEMPTSRPQAPKAQPRRGELGQPDVSVVESVTETAVSNGTRGGDIRLIERQSPSLLASLPDVAEQRETGNSGRRIASAPVASAPARRTVPVSAPVLSETLASEQSEGFVSGSTVHVSTERTVAARATSPVQELRLASAAPTERSKVVVQDPTLPVLSLQNFDGSTVVTGYSASIPARLVTEKVRATMPELIARGGTQRVLVAEATRPAELKTQSVMASDSPAVSLTTSIGASKIAVIPAPTLGRSNPTRFGRLNEGALTTRGASGTAKVAAPRATMPTTVPTAKSATAPRVAAMPSQDNFRSSRPAITVAPVSATHKIPVSYVAPKEEYLSAVAARFGVSAQMLAAVNQIPVQTKLARGQEVKMPREIALNYDGKPVTGDVASMMVGSTSVTAFRFLFEQQGGQMNWDAKGQRVVARNGDQEISLTIGSNKALVNQKEVMMDMAAFLMSGRTMVPVRFFEKSMHAQVEWEPTTGRLFVSISNPTPAL